MLRWCSAEVVRMVRLGWVLMIGGEKELTVVRVRKMVLWRVVVMVVIEPSIALVSVATELVAMA